MRHRPLRPLVPTLAALAIAVLPSAATSALAAADSGAELAALTGRHTRVVWVQDAGPTACVYVERPTVLLMGIDSADGKGERAIVPAMGSFMKPLLSADGQRVLYGDLVAHTVCQVPFAGGTPQVLVRDVEFQDVWRDPADGVEWIYAKVAEQRAGAAVQVLRRFRADQPAVSELVWDRSPIFHVQVSGDGQYASGGAKEGGNTPQGIFTLPNDGFRSPVGGCWPSMAPDDSGRSWIFQGSHRAVHMLFPADPVSGRLSSYSCDISNAPGIPKNVEVYHPRWSNDLRYLAMTGPYATFDWAGEAKITNEVAAGVEVYVGRFTADLHGVEKWVQVTHNQRGDYWPDTWVEPDKTQTQPMAAKKVARPAAAAADARGLEFTYGDATTRNQVTVGKDLRLCELNLGGRARFGRHGVIELGGGSAMPAQATEILAAIRRSGQFTVEATITPAAAQAADPAVLLACGEDLQLVQSAGMLVLRLRTAGGAGAAKGGTASEIPLTALAPGRAQHVVVAYAAGRLLCALDGRRVLLTADAQGDLAPWTASRAQFGSVTGGWSGSIADLAFYSRAVDADEARAHHAVAQAAGAKRTPAAQVVVEAVLKGRSPAPSPQAIAPYRRSLSLSAYDITKVVSGTLADKRVVVAQWSVMDGAILPEYQAVQPGATVRLVLESFDDHPEQESERQTNTLTGVDELPLFYDVTPAAVAAVAPRTVAWSGAAGQWRTAASWSAGGIPSSADRVELGEVAGAPRTVTSTAPETIRELALLQAKAAKTPANVLVVAAPLTIAGSATPLSVGAGAALTIPSAPLAIANDTLAVELAGTAVFGGGGGVAAALIDQGGAGYRSAPEVVFAGPASVGLGTGATAQATLAVGNLRLSHVGSGYTAAPTLVFSAPEIAGGRTAAANVKVDAQGALTGVQLTDGGSGYLAMPTVRLEGGGGTGAVVEALGRVAAITLLTSGSGYTAPPAVTLNGGGGRGASARAFAQATSVAFSGSQGDCGFTNSGTLEQRGSLLAFDWCAERNNTGKDRDLHNRGIWRMVRAAVDFGSSTGRGLWLGHGCTNEGTLVVDDGSQFGCGMLASSGKLELGPGAVVGSPAYANSDMTLRNTGTMTVAASAGRPAVFGGTVPEGNGPRVLQNGDGQAAARLVLAAGAEFAVLGGKVQVENAPGAELVITAGSALGLLTSDLGSNHAFNNRDAVLINRGRLVLAGTVRFQGNHAGMVGIDSDDEVVLAGEAVYERLVHSSGEGGYYNANGTPALLRVRSGGSFAGAGALRFRNSSGRPAVGTLRMVVAGTLSPTGAAGKAATIILGDTALVLGAKDLPPLGEKPAKAKAGQPAAQVAPAGGPAVLAVAILGAGVCDQVVVEETPQLAPATKRQKDDEPEPVGVTITAGVDTVLDVRTTGAVHGTFTVLRAPRIAGTFAKLRLNGADSTAYTVRYSPTAVEVVFP